MAIEFFATDSQRIECGTVFRAPGTGSTYLKDDFLGGTGMLLGADVNISTEPNYPIFING